MSFWIKAEWAVFCCRLANLPKTFEIIVERNFNMLSSGGRFLVVYNLLVLSGGPFLLVYNLMVSEPELRSFWAEPSRAGALWFPSWNRANNTNNMYVKKFRFCASIMILCSILWIYIKRIGIFGVKHYNLGT